MEGKRTPSVRHTAVAASVTVKDDYSTLPLREL
jgi:hypothetical protein